MSRSLAGDDQQMELPESAIRMVENDVGGGFGARPGRRSNRLHGRCRNCRAPITGGYDQSYAIASTSRNPSVPTTPTTIEAGLPEFQTSRWFALFAPKGTPKPILDRLTDALDRALDDEGTRKRLIELANDLPKKSRRGQQALRVLLKNEIARWTSIIQAANVKAE